MVMVASRGRRWCWWLAGSSVVVPGVGGVGGWPSSSGLSAAVWAVVTQPAVVSGSSAHPDRSAKVVMVRRRRQDKTLTAASIKWRPQQAYGSNHVLLVQPQTVFSTPKIITLTHR